MIDNSEHPYGSAAFAELEDFRSAGMLTQRPNSLLAGFIEDRPIWYSGMGGVLIVAGARGGKLATVLGYNICSGICTHTVLILDMKGELAAISQDQTPDRKFNIHWNPKRLHGLPSTHINPVDYLRIDSPSLIGDTKIFCQNWIARSGSGKDMYFVDRARGEFLEAMVLTNVRLHGVLTLPDLYRSVNLIPGGGPAWLDFAFEMQESGFEISSRIEEEIAATRARPDTGGMQGILGELFRSFSCLSDPQLMESVSPPFDFSMAQMCESNQAYQVYLMPPAENVEGWAPVLKSLFVAGKIYKGRAPQAPQQTWFIDECAQLGGFPLVVQLFTYGAGINVRPVAVYQSDAQMNATAADGESIISASAALQLRFALREIMSARRLSDMLGPETLEVHNAVQDARSRHAAQQAITRIFSGGDLIQAALDYEYHSQVAGIPTRQQRLLRTPGEVLNTPGDRMYLFADGLGKPAYVERKPYYEQRFMAGRFHPNPFYPPLDKVRIKGLIGHRWRPVIREPVPPRFAHYPQYADGFWSRIG